MKRWIKDRSADLTEPPVLIVAGLVLLIGGAFFIEKATGCHSTCYPAKTAKRQAKKDYPSCRYIKVLSETEINYKEDKYRRSTVKLNVCGEKCTYLCFLDIPFSNDTPATYECREAEVDLQKTLRRILQNDG